MGPAHAPGVCHGAIVDGMRPPGLGPAAAAVQPSALILCNSRWGIRLTGTLAGLDALDVRCDSAHFLGLRPRIRLGLLLGPLTRMHHDKPEVLHGDPPLTIFHRHLPDDAVAMPAARRFVLGPPRLLD